MSSYTTSRELVRVKFLKPFAAYVERSNMSNSLSENQVLIKTKFSGISTGTELLFYRGLVPESLETDALFSRKPVSYPISYGYSLVGTVVEVGNQVDPHIWLGRRVFCFSPHQSYVICQIDQLLCIPDNVEFEDAIFLPWMETAICLVHDGAPLLGDHAVIFGQGVVGLLLAALLCFFPLASLSVVENSTNRKEISRSFVKNAQFYSPVEVEQSHFLLCGNNEDRQKADMTFEVSGNAEALNEAILCTRYDGRVIIGSWFGKQHISLPAIGSYFHRSHLTIISSQVSFIPPHLSGRWDKQRRFGVAWEHIKKLQPSQLISKIVKVDEACRVYEQMDADPNSVVQILFTYD
ncbi:hypothetical protein GpartN1_g2350.t1 [Galdieria partita]|uniref:Alcohol dehydrogenase-like N-terminal domain-containing protein n=1 Tax=Galdieria partita TaxID=83374 RepID=A0A9C7PU97_9RHOD|nr:hypothetical protein GpartN1_g2350.t1 [Galdieria partita]